MSWISPVLRCLCGHVGKPRLVEGTSAHTWTALCRQCAAPIKQLPRLGEPAPAASAEPRGAQLYAKTDLARAALQELARRKLLALGIDPATPPPGKHTDG